MLADLRNRAELLSEAAEEIERQWEAPELERHRLSTVKRFETVAEHAREAIADAGTEVQIAVTPVGYRDVKESLATAHENGALVKVTVHTEGDADPPPADAFEGVATEVRHRTLPTPFVASSTGRRPASRPTGIRRTSTASSSTTTR